MADIYSAVVLPTGELKIEDKEIIIALIGAAAVIIASIMREPYSSLLSCVISPPL